MEIKSTSSSLDLTPVKRTYIAFQFFFSLLLWVPIFYEYQKTIGLNDQEIFQIQSYYYFIFCFLEIPTGYISDRFGHKTAMVFGSLILTGTNLIPIWATSYTSFFIHFVFIATARSLISGAASAYLYEYLNKNGEIDTYKETEGRARSLGLIGKVIGWGAVGYLMQWWLPSPYIITTCFSFIAFITAMKLPNNLSFVPMKSDHIFLSFRHVFYYSNLLSSILLGIGLFVMIRICQINLYQPLLSSRGFEVYQFGILMGAMTLLESFGAKYAFKIKNITDPLIIFLSTTIVFFCFILMISKNQVLIVLAFIIFSFFAGIAFPVQRKLLNDNIQDGQSRATILSVESIFDRLTTALIVMAIGPFIETSIEYVFIVVAIFAWLIVLSGYKKYNQSI